MMQWKSLSLSIYPGDNESSWLLDDTPCVQFSAVDMLIPLSVIKIVVQIQIRLGNSARTIALRRAFAKIPNYLICFYFILLTISSLELCGIVIIFLRFPCSFAIEVSPLFQTTPVLTKKIMVEGMGVFFQFPIKGERKREKKRKGERNVQSSIN